MRATGVTSCNHRFLPWNCLQTGIRDARYEFVHELIRATLVQGLSLPRRQRLHLKIADALERLRAASLASHASVLAHHLYQAGAAADAQSSSVIGCHVLCQMNSPVGTGDRAVPMLAPKVKR